MKIARSVDSAQYVHYSRHMDSITAVKAFAALAQPTRLAVFRHLIVHSEGVAAGELARGLNVPHNTMSAHLSVLLSAGLLNSQRESRSIIYHVDREGLRSLLGFILEDCCHGRPSTCTPFVSTLIPDSP